MKNIIEYINEGLFGKKKITKQQDHTTWYDTHDLVVNTHVKSPEYQKIIDMLLDKQVMGSNSWGNLSAFSKHIIAHTDLRKYVGWDFNNQIFFSSGDFKISILHDPNMYIEGDDAQQEIYVDCSYDPDPAPLRFKWMPGGKFEVEGPDPDTADEATKKLYKDYPMVWIKGGIEKNPSKAYKIFREFFEKYSNTI